MDRVTLENVIHKIHGCTFASVDAFTTPSPGIRKETKGKRVILFNNINSSGYENMVRRRLLEAGKDGSNFSLGDLPWGQRVPGTPIIEHKGKVYLQCIELAEGQSKYFLFTGKEVDPADLNLPEKRKNQGLSPEDEVHVCCYNIESITRIALMGEELVASAEQRTILKIDA